MAKYKAPVNVTNKNFDIKHSKTIKDRFFLYSNKVSTMLPAAIIQRHGNEHEIKVLEPQTGEHTTLKNKAGTFNEVVALCERHFNLA